MISSGCETIFDNVTFTRLGTNTDALQGNAIID
jgi:hypothetical protein